MILRTTSPGKIAPHHRHVWRSSSFTNQTSLSFMWFRAPKFPSFFSKLKAFYRKTPANFECPKLYRQWKAWRCIMFCINFTSRKPQVSPLGPQGSSEHSISVAVANTDGKVALQARSNKLPNPNPMEQSKKGPWLVGLYRGWTTTQLY